jgi:hypothetical protein
MAVSVYGGDAGYTGYLYSTNVSDYQPIQYTNSYNVIVSVYLHNRLPRVYP